MKTYKSHPADMENKYRVVSYPVRNGQRHLVVKQKYDIWSREWKFIKIVKKCKTKEEADRYVFLHALTN